MANWLNRSGSSDPCVYLLNSCDRSLLICQVLFLELSNTTSYSSKNCDGILISYSLHRCNKLSSFYFQSKLSFLCMFVILWIYEFMLLLLLLCLSRQIKTCMLNLYDWGIRWHKQGLDLYEDYPSRHHHMTCIKDNPAYTLAMTRMKEIPKCSPQEAVEILIVLGLYISHRM